MSSVTQRFRNSALSVAAGWTFSVLTVASGAVATPFILAALGPERFGAFRTMIDAFAYPALLEGGLTGSLMACLAKAIGSQDMALALRLLGAARRAYLGITAAMLASGAMLVAVLPYLIHLPAPESRELRIAAFILLAVAVLTPAALFRAVAEARQRGYLVQLSLTATALLTALFSVGAARAGLGLPGQAAAVLLASALVIPFLATDATSAFPGWLHARTDRAATAAIRSLNAPIFLFNLSGRLGMLSDNLILAALLSPAAVAPFYLTQRIVAVLQIQLLNIGNATWAGIADLHFRGEHGTCRERLLELTNLASSAGVAVLIPIAAYNRYFVSLWVGAAMYGGDGLTLLACFNAWLGAIVNLWTSSLNGIGEVRRMVPFQLSSLVLNLALSIACTHWLGRIGPLIGTTAALLAVNTWTMSRLLGRSFGLSMPALFLNALRPLSWGLPYAIGVWFAAQRWPPGTWWQLLAACSVATLGAAMLLFAFMPATTQRIWRARVKSLTDR